MLLSSPSANIITDIYRNDITDNRQFLSNSESRFNFSWLTPEAQSLTVQGDRCQRKRGAIVPWCVCCHLETKSVNNTWHFQFFKNCKKIIENLLTPNPLWAPFCSVLPMLPEMHWGGERAPFCSRVFQPELRHSFQHVLLCGPTFHVFIAIYLWDDGFVILKPAREEQMARWAPRRPFLAWAVVFWIPVSFSLVWMTWNQCTWVIFYKLMLCLCWHMKATLIAVDSTVTQVPDLF